MGLFPPAPKQHSFRGDLLPEKYSVSICKIYCQQLPAPFVWWEAGMTAQHASCPLHPHHNNSLDPRALVPLVPWVAASTVHPLSTYPIPRSPPSPPRTTHPPFSHSQVPAQSLSIVKRAPRRCPHTNSPSSPLSYKSPTKTRLPYKSRLSTCTTIGEYLEFHAHHSKTQVTPISHANPTQQSARIAIALPAPILFISSHQPRTA